MPKLILSAMRGTRAAQPLATAVIPGTLYYVTDESTTEQSRGGAWLSYADGGGVSADYVVLSDGVEPPTPVSDGLGNFIYVAYTP